MKKKHTMKWYPASKDNSYFITMIVDYYKAEYEADGLPLRKTAVMLTDSLVLTIRNDGTKNISIDSTKRPIVFNMNPIAQKKCPDNRHIIDLIFSVGESISI